MNLAHKKVLVLGLAKSGMAAITLLLKHGCTITLNESKQREDLEEADALEASGVRLVLGEQPASLFEEDFDYVVKNPGIKYTEWFILRLQERHIPIYTEIEVAYQFAPSHHYIAVTGTNGKTTTVSLIGAILNDQFPGKAHVAGNIGTPLSEVVVREGLEDCSGHYIVIEFSNFQLLNIDTFRPEACTIINLTPDHLDYMRNVDEYYASKTRIYENQGSNDVFVLNMDDKNIQTYVKKNPPHGKIETLSLTSTADFSFDGVHLRHHNDILINRKDILMVGLQNVQNALMAMALCLAVGVDQTKMVQSIASFTGVEHRVEFVREVDGVRYYNDSKGTNVDATMTALKSFDNPIILLVGGKDKHLSMEPLKPYLTNVSLVIGYGACGERLVRDLVGDNGQVVETLDQAVALAKRHSHPGDVVLLSPTTSSFDQFKSFEERGRYFKRLVKAL